MMGECHQWSLLQRKFLIFLFPDGQQSRSVEGDAPTYVIEHLATFTVSKEAGVVYPADGMRRLLQLEKSNGIWSQKMQLRLDQNWVLIMDYETGVSPENLFVCSRPSRRCGVSITTKGQFLIYLGQNGKFY